jgi:hypothetical protein
MIQTQTQTPARAWCEAISRGLHVEQIDRDRKPYLLRYFLAGWNPVTKRPGPSAFLHHFVASDPSDTVHSHPWGWSQSLILVGGYREHRCALDGTHTVHDYGPGDVNTLRATDTHRIELLEADCWTLFLTGSVEQSWNFSPTC